MHRAQHVSGFLGSTRRNPGPLGPGSLCGEALSALECPFPRKQYTTPPIKKSGLPDCYLDDAFDTETSFRVMSVCACRLT
jgi:hypothetical protein